MQYLKLKRDEIRCSLYEERVKVFRNKEFMFLENMRDDAIWDLVLEIWLFKIALDTKPNFEEFEDLEDPVGSICRIDEVIRDAEKGLDEDSKTKLRRLINPKRDFLNDLMDLYDKEYFGR